WTAFCRKTPGKHFCHVLYHGLGKAFHRVPDVAANNRHCHVQALATAGLQESGQFELLKEVAQKDGSLLHGLPFHTVTRVQVKGNSVRSVDTAAYRIPGVKLYGVQLGSLGKAQGVAYNDKWIMARVELRVQFHDSGKPLRVHVFLKK